MKYKNAFWLSLVCGITLACSPVLAQNGAPPPPQQPQPNPMRAGRAQQPPPPPMTLEERDAQRTIPAPYRLTYTLTEMDGAKRIGSQRYAIVVGADETRTFLKLGTKIPIETGESKAGSVSHTDISYIDVGMNIAASLRQFANGLELSSDVVQSAVDSPQSLLKTPVIRQTSLESTILLNENKPIILGNVDTPGSTHSLQVTVELTRVQ
ncbi:MAG: hypothetical protein ACYCO5_14210 [Acidobacteriaceae bacterium]